MKNQNLDKLGKEMMKYPGVTGYAKTLQKRQRKGKIENEICLQIHVREKIPEKALRKRDILPKSAEGIPIDVVVVGDLKLPLPPKKKVSVKEKTDEIRPLVAGISIGNASISAGTLGWFMEKIKSPDKGEVFLGSNSHVLCDEPKDESSLEKRIYQPGPYDGGNEIVAEYYWHEQLHPSGGPSFCQLSMGIAGLLNGLSKGFGRKTRFIPVIQEVNYIDFAVARMIVEWKDKFFDGDITNSFNFVGFGFAGSNDVSLTCKGKYIKEAGYMPKGFDLEVDFGGVLHKTGRTSCYSNANVKAGSVYEIINFGAYNVEFDDVVMSEILLQPGDSGSAVFKKKS